MNKTRILILGLCLMVAVAYGDGSDEEIISEPGWVNASPYTEFPSLPDGDMETTNTPPMPSQSGFLASGYPGDQPAVAEAVTPEIQTLADILDDDPLRIYNYVHDNIRQVLYFGSKKGAQLTLLEKSGNDFDQCALLVALLRAAGYSNNVGYQCGLQTPPFSQASLNTV